MHFALDRSPETTPQIRRNVRQNFFAAFAAFAFHGSVGLRPLRSIVAFSRVAGNRASRRIPQGRAALRHVQPSPHPLDVHSRSPCGPRYRWTADRPRSSAVTRSLGVAAAVQTRGVRRAEPARSAWSTRFPPDRGDLLSTAAARKSRCESRRATPGASIAAAPADPAPNGCVRPRREALD